MSAFNKHNKTIKCCARCGSNPCCCFKFSNCSRCGSNPCCCLKVSNCSRCGSHPCRCIPIPIPIPVSSDPQSAFRAVNISGPRKIPKNTNTKIFYPNEEFDLANEYNPTTSTFTPAKKGVYSIIASVEFQPDRFCKFYSIAIYLRVNGNIVAADNDFFASTPPEHSNVATVSTIIQLNAGDVVDVTFDSTLDGKIESNHPERTIRFEAARFPSPHTSKC